MAPKTLPPAAKQALILGYFHNSRTAHSIKDLEKALPSVASINGMQVKDYLQALSDDGKIRVEKIGSGNWYWSFRSEEKKNKEGILDNMKGEMGKLSAAVTELEEKIEEETVAREEGGGDDDQDRSSLTATHTRLQQQITTLRVELASYSDNDPREVFRKKKETKKLMAVAERWTDNIYSLESYLLGLTQDREALENMKREYYGSEYVEGEGLAEL